MLNWPCIGGDLSHFFAVVMVVNLQVLDVARFVLFSCLVLVPWVEANTVNRIIDDTFGESVTQQRVVYVPALGIWNDATCPSIIIDWWSKLILPPFRKAYHWLGP